MSARDSGPLDVLAIMAHPDDAELLCGGSLIRSADEAALEDCASDLAAALARAGLTAVPGSI